MKTFNEWVEDLMKLGGITFLTNPHDGIRIQHSNDIHKPIVIFCLTNKADRSRFETPFEALHNAYLHSIGILA